MSMSRRTALRAAIAASAAAIAGRALTVEASPGWTQPAGPVRYDTGTLEEFARGWQENVVPHVLALAPLSGIHPAQPLLTPDGRSQYLPAMIRGEGAGNNYHFVQLWHDGVDGHTLVFDRETLRAALAELDATALRPKAGGVGCEVCRPDLFPPRGNAPIDANHHAVRFQPMMLAQVLLNGEPLPRVVEFYAGENGWALTHAGHTGLGTDLRRNGEHVCACGSDFIALEAFEGAVTFVPKAWAP